MLAFHGDHTIKDKYLARVTQHEKLDQIIKGRYWVNGKGCAVGCTIHSGEHAAYETELGIPRIIAKLEDGIFEGLPNDLAKTWPRRFLEVIKPGADLSMVWPHFAVWLLTDPLHGVLKYAKTDAQREAIQTISDMYLFVTNGAVISSIDWKDAYATADAAAAYADAAYAAAAYAAAYAADAAYAAAYADAATATAYAADAAYAAYAADAAYAAYAAAYADAAYADAATATAYAADAAYAAAATATNKRNEMRTIQSNKLLELLRDAK